MGLGSFISGASSTVLTRYRADTSDHKRAVKGLRGQQKAQAKEALEGLEAQNRAIDDNIKKWGKIAASIGVASIAVAALKSGFAAFQKDSQLRLAASGADIDSLKKATRGLVTEQRLLEFAAANANTQFKLSAQDMQIAAKAAISLRNQGNDLDDTLNRLQKSIVEGSTEPLKELGITIKATSGTMEASREIVQRLREENNKLGSDTVLATDSVAAASVSMKDSFRDLKIELGKFASSMGPLIEAFAKLLGLAARAANLLLGGSVTDIGGFKDILARREALARISAFDDRNAVISSQFGGGPTDGPFESSDPFEGRDISKRSRSRRSKKKVLFDALADASLEDSDLRLLNEELGLILDPDSQSGPLFRSGLIADELKLQSEAAAGVNEQFRLMTAALEMYSDGALVGMLRTNALNIALSATSSAAQGAFDSWVRGSISAGDALKQFAGDVISGIANQMFAKALFHGASAVGSLALGNIPGAGFHAKAAGLFAAGAVATGALARQFGGGGAGASTTPATSGLGGAAAGGGGGSRNTIIVLGHQFSEDDRRRRGEQVQDALRRSKQYGGDISNVVEYA